MNFLSLTFSPNALIGIDSSLQVPVNFKFKSNAKKTIFDYPEHIKPEDAKEKKKQETITLSTTVRAKARHIKKAGDGDKMEEEKPSDSSVKPS